MPAVPRGITLTAHPRDKKRNPLTDLPPLPAGPFRFIALDVETANHDPASICQIGLAFVREDNGLVTWARHVDPRDDFSPFNIRIHGITPEVIARSLAPVFADVLTHLLPVLTSHTVFQHSDFDRRALTAACAAAGITPPAIRWADSVRIARRAWPELRGNGGHGLASLRSHLGLNFRHHDGEEDARAAAEVVLHAEARTGERFDALLQPAPAARQYPSRMIRSGSGQPD